MGGKLRGELLPYRMTEPGFELVYTGETDLSQFKSDDYFAYQTDDCGNVYFTYSLWGFARTKPEQWEREILLINEMQKGLGELDEDTRNIRRQIAGLICCDRGVPVTIDEILQAIGSGKLPEHPFSPGCWAGYGDREAIPEQRECMRAIRSLLEGLLSGIKRDVLTARFPQAKNLIDRCYDWFPGELSEVQKLLLRRALLPFPFFTGESADRQACHAECYGENGAGQMIDGEISAKAGLPRIYPNYRREYRETLTSIEDPEKKELYRICGHLAHGICELSECHHNAFRAIERWIHGIGTLKWDIPGRAEGRERERLGRLLFGYALALDRWMQKVPEPFLLSDLGFIDLGFDPKNEILRVYAYLGGDRTPVKMWLTACLWYALTLEATAGLFTARGTHRDLIQRAKACGLSVRDWMDRRLDANLLL